MAVKQGALVQAALTGRFHEHHGELTGIGTQLIAAGDQSRW